MGRVSNSAWLQPLEPLRAPLAREFAERVVGSLGPCAGPSLRLLARGIAPPCALVGMNLALLVSQPRPPRADGSRAPDGVAGGVWVRERVTMHRPVRIDEELVTVGGGVRRYVRKGRRYSTTLSETRDATGELVVTTETTGLARYRADPSLADSEEGPAEDAVPHPAPDPRHAAANPALDAIRALRVGDAWSGPAAHVTLALMRARDGARPRNPIHTDPEAARAAGLDAPIAGGSHVLAYAQELALERLGDEALSYGACTDTRWLSPVRADQWLESHVRVARTSPDTVELALEALCAGSVAMRSTLTIPLPPRVR
jgi:acyl dehydratase